MNGSILGLAFTAVLSSAVFTVSLTSMTEEAVASDGRVPSFKAYPNGSSTTIWNTLVGEFSYSENCTVARRDRTYFLTERRQAFRPKSEISKSQIEGPYAVWCEREFDVPHFSGTINIGGYQATNSDFAWGSLSSGTPVKPAISHLQKSLANNEAFDVEIYREPNFNRGAETYTFSFRPPRGSSYVRYMNDFFRLADRKNYEVAKLRRIEEKREKIVWGLSILGAVVALTVLAKLLMSAPARQKIRTLRTRMSGAFRRPKFSFRRKGNLSAAKELMYWSELKDKGDITQEEFEERKKQLLGKA